MSTSVSALIKWSKRIPPENRLLDPLGLGAHLAIQIEFTNGITSVTNRLRYLTLLAWYRENFSSENYVKESRDLKNLERVLILSSLAHHNGDIDDPRLDQMFNKTRFEKDWNSRKKFELDNNFDIQGYGKTYYNANLGRLGGSYVDMFGRIKPTKITTKLASCLRLDKSILEKKELIKSELNNYQDLCICQIAINKQERDILSKMLFGFVNSDPINCDINEEEFLKFRSGDIELDFEKIDSLKLNVETKNFRKNTIKRRNTLFLLLKIMSYFENGIIYDEFRRTIWDAVYFSQKRDDHKKISFGRLERIREYWEYLQLNVYYVFAMESILDVINSIVTENPHIHMNSLMEVVKHQKIMEELEVRINRKLSANLKINEAITFVWSSNKIDRSSLDTKLNEATTYDRIRSAESIEQRIANILILLILLERRFNQTKNEIRRIGSMVEDDIIIEDEIEIGNTLSKLSKSDKTINEFFTDLMSSIVIRHLFESSSDFKERGTKSWMFVEEGGFLIRARRKPYRVNPRDNRWESILYFLIDLQFIEMKGDNYMCRIIPEGKEWIKMIN